MFNPELDLDDSLILHTDLYEINMMYTYFKKGISERKAVFEVYFRKEPFGNGYALFAGLSHMIDYIKKIHFAESDLQYLKENENYDDDFISYLRNLKINLTVRSAQEGELVFANEPIVQVEGPLAQC
ncbi:MAG: nicotinate phosphoribosyltransferase, partial [Lactobacillus iners]|nr:nicotinate phosphoribosyltransferase [Lactobacillus iners]